jgi:hypothetical protein
VFISSPADVDAEAGLVRQALRQVEDSAAWRGKFTFDIIRWNDPDAPTPMDARLTPQEAVDRGRPKPSECDVTVVILWSRFGTPLSTPKRPDGTQFLSGTEYEVEDARANPRSRILLYRRLDEPVASLRTGDFAARQHQLQLVDAFFARFTAADGSLSAGYKSYRGVEGFASLFRGDLEHAATTRSEAPALTRPPRDSRCADPRQHPLTTSPSGGDHPRSSSWIRSRSAAETALQDFLAAIRVAAFWKHCLGQAKGFAAHVVHHGSCTTS